MGERLVGMRKREQQTEGEATEREKLTERGDGTEKDETELDV